MNNTEMDIKYRLGIEEIDSQHARWLALYREIRDFMDDPGEGMERKNELKVVIVRMYDYARTHLRYEERFMENMKYPRIDEHIDRHRELDRNISDLFARLFRDEDIKGVELLGSIEDWLFTHILREDRQIADYLETRGLDYRNFLPAE